MNVELGTTEDERKELEELIRVLDDSRTLKILRDETAVLILMVRVENEQRRMKYAEMRRRQEEEGEV